MLRYDLDTDRRDWLHVGDSRPTERRPAKKKRAKRWGCNVYDTFNRLGAEM